MLIKSAQEIEALEKIQSDLIKGGREPVVSEVDNMLNDYRLNHDFGEPLYNLHKVESLEKSDPNLWNKEFFNLAKDLEIAYKAYESVRNDVAVSERTVFASQLSLFSEIEKLNSRIDSLKESIAGDIAYTTASYNFGDFSNINFYSSNARNIPATTSFIDILHNKATSEKVSLPSDVIDLQNSKIKISMNGVLEVESEGSEKDVLKIGNKKSFTLKASDRGHGSKFVNVDVTLKKSVEASTLEIKMALASKAKCTALLKLKNGDVEELYSEYASTNIEWVFSKVEIVGFTIIIEKSKHDGIENQNFTYYFSIKSVLLCNDKYETASTLVTNPMRFDVIADSLKLNVQDFTPGGTGISYFAAIDNNSSNVLSWIPVKNNEITNLNILKKDEIILNKNSKDFGKFENGCYYLGKMKEFSNKNSLLVLQGYQQWFVEALVDSKFDSKYIININDYNKSLVKSVGFLHHETYTWSIKPKALLALSTTVFNYEDNTSKDFFIKTGENVQATIIVNNSIVKLSDNKINIPFMKGSNTVKILLFNSSEANVLVSHNISFTEIGKDSTCGGKAQFVSKDTLKNGAMDTNPNALCIDSSGNIYSKINPFSECSYISSINTEGINNLNYFRCFVKYRYLDKADYSKYLVNKSMSVQIRIMALLNSCDSSISPAIKSYSVLII